MIPLLICLLFATSCSKDDNVNPIFKEDFVDLGTHKLKTYSVESNSSYFIIFESGLGYDHSVWQTKKIAEDISETMDHVIYDRGGYGQSTIREFCI